jgi:ribonuclease-3|tara:strand:- start:11549 stop:12256 length:708 start_codon:yes stop_codon:yes gene_type:complete
MKAPAATAYQQKISNLCVALGYSFADVSLLELALTHRSCGHRNNERLEFLGDSIVNFVIANALFDQFPRAQEGQLSRLRAGLVKGVTLAQVAQEMHIGPCLKLGVGELKSGGQRRESILADATEAIIGAIYKDAGMDICQARILDWFNSRLENLSLSDTHKDPKTRLQEYLQAKRLDLPVYTLIDVKGQDHEQMFIIECHTSLLDKPTQAEASSRRIAEQKSATLALQQLGQESL